MNPFVRQDGIYGTIPIYYPTFLLPYRSTLYERNLYKKNINVRTRHMSVPYTVQLYVITLHYSHAWKQPVILENLANVQDRRNKQI